MRNKAYKISNHKKNNKSKLKRLIRKKVINTCQQKIIIKTIKHKHQVFLDHLWNIYIT